MAASPIPGPRAIPLLGSKGGLLRFFRDPGAHIARKMQGITMGPRHGIPMRIDAQDRRFASPTRVRGDIHELVDLPA